MLINQQINSKIESFIARLKFATLDLFNFSIYMTKGEKDRQRQDRNDIVKLIFGDAPQIVLKLTLIF